MGVQKLNIGVQIAFSQSPIILKFFSNFIVPPGPAVAGICSLASGVWFCVHAAALACLLTLCLLNWDTSRPGWERSRLPTPYPPSGTSQPCLLLLGHTGFFPDCLTSLSPTASGLPFLPFPYLKCLPPFSPSVHMAPLRPSSPITTQTHFELPPPTVDSPGIVSTSCSSQRTSQYCLCFIAPCLFLTVQRDSENVSG